MNEKKYFIIPSVAFVLLTMFTIQAMETNNNCTLLHCAAKEGNTQKINILLYNDADINSTYCDFNNTPLHVACWFGHTDCVKMLIRRGAKLDIPNMYGSTPVHTASWKNEALCLEILLENDAPFCNKNNTGSGNTPLYLAAKAGSTECLKILLNHIKYYVYNNQHKEIDSECSGDNYTPLQIAAVGEHAQCYWDLVIAGADYTKKIHDDNVTKSISECIESNNRLFKNFIYRIECFGKNDPEPFYGFPYKHCFLCIQNFIPNDVVIQIKECSQTFHASCFENYCVRYFIEKNKDEPWIISLKNNAPDKEFEHFIKTNRAGTVPFTNQCPHCKKSFDPQHSLSMGVLSKEDWYKLTYK